MVVDDPMTCMQSCRGGMSLSSAESSVEAAAHDAEAATKLQLLIRFVYDKLERRRYLIMQPTAVR